VVREKWDADKLREYRDKPWVARQFERDYPAERSFVELSMTVGAGVSDYLNVGLSEFITTGIAGFQDARPTTRVKTTNGLDITVRLNEEAALAVLGAFDRKDKALERWFAPLALKNVAIEPPKEERESAEAQVLEPFRLDGSGIAATPRTAVITGQRPPDRVVMISDWLTEIGGGVNTVVKDQIDCLSRDHGVPVDILMDGGDYEPGPPATLTIFHDTANPDSIYDVLRKHIVDPVAQDLRIAVIIHNVLTIPFSWPQKQALRRIMTEVSQDPALENNVQFVAWSHDVFDVPDELLPGVTYVTISEERQAFMAEYFHQPRSRFLVARNAVNLRRLLDLSPEADWLWKTFRLHDEDFVALYPVRLARNKNIEGAISIVAALNQLGKRTTLIVPGLTAEWQRDYYNELRERAAAAGIPEKVISLTDLTFQGEPLQVSDRVIRDFYKLATFLLFTSRDEGFGLPLIEAGSFRLPAVISTIPPLMRISQETDTLIVDPDREPMERIALRIVDYMDRNPSYGMQRRVFSRYNMDHQFEALGWNLPTTPHAPCRIGAQTSRHFCRWRVEDQFLDALHNGLDGFEVFFDPEPQWSSGFGPEDLKEDIRAWLRENARERDVELSVYVCRHIRDLAERHLHWQQCLTFAHDIGAEILAVDLPPPEAFPAGGFDAFVDDLQALIDTAWARHIRIVVENGAYKDASGTLILTAAEHLNDLFTRLSAGGGGIGVSFNAGRAHLWGDPVAYLRRIHPPIFHVKLSDNQGPGHDEVHERLGEGKLPLEPVLDELNRREYRGMIVLEYFYADLRRDRALIEAVLSPTR
jgi:sugar phosphate isomerase/epimerase